MTTCVTAAVRRKSVWRISTVKPQRTWILIADGARARVLVHRGVALGLEPVEGMAMTFDHRRARDIGSDKPGRSFESVGATRHAVSPHTDPERNEEKRFAHEIAERLDKEAERVSFDRLVLVAPPTMLGDLRNALTPRLSALVSATLDKDLTKTPEKKLAQHLAEILPVK